MSPQSFTVGRRVVAHSGTLFIFICNDMIHSVSEVPRFSVKLKKKATAEPILMKLRVYGVESTFFILKLSFSQNYVRFHFKITHKNIDVFFFIPNVRIRF